MRMYDLEHLLAHGGKLVHDSSARQIATDGDKDVLESIILRERSDRAESGNTFDTLDFFPAVIEECDIVESALGKLETLQCNSAMHARLHR